MLGVLAAYFKYYYARFWKSKKVVLFILGIIILLINKYIIINVSNFYHSVFSFFFISVGTMLILPAISSYKKASLKVSKIITYISLISYSMYLVNLSLVQLWIISRFSLFEKLNNYMPYSNFLIYLVLVYFISFFIYKYFEVPTTKLRDKKEQKELNSSLIVETIKINKERN